MVQMIGLTNTFVFLIGIYFVSAGLGVFIEPKSARRLMSKLSRNPIICYLSGFAAFGIGAAIVATHNDWSGVMPAFVTLVGWIALIEGALLFALRERLVRRFEPLARNTDAMRIMGGVIAVLGVLLVILALL